MNKEIAKDVICAYLSNGESIDAIASLYDIKSGDNEVLLNHIKALKNIFENAIKEMKQPKKELIKPSHYDENINVEYELEKARKFIEEDKKRKFGDK